MQKTICNKKSSKINYNPTKNNLCRIFYLKNKLTMKKTKLNSEHYFWGKKCSG